MNPEPINAAAVPGDAPGWTLQLSGYRGHWYFSARQRGHADCGAAALLACRLQHAVTPNKIENLQSLEGAGGQGVSIAELMHAADRTGQAARAVHADRDAFEHLPLPAVALLRLPDGRGHYVALHAVDNDGVLIANPSHDGLMFLDIERFLAAWTGKLVLLA